MDLLRFTTAGSVDDGKSTLIGRLLYDSKSIFEDQYEAIRASTERRGEEGVNLALLTDGLKAEREQGITIDVAYRYFATPKRKFIIADTPGHIQYTRNMVTGASTANLAIILVDARNGVVEQTKRHAYIASLLQIPHVAVCINKMDLVDWDEATFERIKADFSDVAAKLDVQDVHFIPISALRGDNVVNKSDQMPWYGGSTLMYLLETLHIASDRNMIDARFPVQFVVRPNNDEFHDYRGYAGRIAGGIFRKGDKVLAMPSGFVSRIRSITCGETQLEEAFAPQSVAIELEDDIDISRGDMIVREANVPTTTQDLEAMVCWFNDRPLNLGGKYLLLHTSRESRCIVKDIRYKMDINQLVRNTDDKVFRMNDIGRVVIRTQSPLFIDSYRKNRITGSFVLVDEGTNETVAAGMIV
jgi:sulfate adenylyltransferase subunit 1